MTMPQTLLIVDDDERNRDMLGRRMQRAGYDVRLAASGQEALSAIAQTPIDLVLLDIMMPGMSGIDVLRALRGQPATARLPVVAVSARAQAEDVVEALDSGADDYVTKPVDLAIILARVRTQLARRRAEQALLESEERYALAVRGTNDGVWDWRLTDNTVYYSPRWSVIMAYNQEPPPPTIDAWLDRVHADDVQRVRSELDDHLRGATVHLESEHRIRRGGSYRWVLVRGVAVRDAEGRPLRVAGSVTDITEGKVADALTGLPNRVLFNDRLGRLFEHAKRSPEFQFAVLFLDLDHFKTINDGLGHRVGDALLVETAHRLERNLRAADSISRLDRRDPALAKVAGHTVARFGGDEFAITLSGITRPADATRAAERLSHAIAAPVSLDHQEVVITATIGIALSATGYERPEDMLRDADIALYRAKARGRGRCEIFDETMRHAVLRRLELETDLRHAVERREFVLHYQPIVELRTGRVTGLEALLRWNHPVRGLLLPAEFIPVAEETGLIVDIGFWAIEEASRQMALWRGRSAGAELPLLSVNVSARQLAGSHFVERVCGIVDETGLPRQGLEIEITESAMITDLEASHGALRRLDAEGFSLALDDFGTGYSSLSYLQRFPVSRLKLDRTFLNAKSNRDETGRLMESIVLLANHLRLDVVVEGIETDAQLEKARLLRCRFGQGFYFSPAVAPGDLPPSGFAVPPEIMPNG
jgi:PAS domain S-box-containing protein